MSTTSTKIEVVFDAKLDRLFSERRTLGVIITNQTGTPLKNLDKRGSGDHDKMVYTYLVEPLNEHLLLLLLRKL